MKRERSLPHCRDLSAVRVAPREAHRRTPLGTQPALVATSLPIIPRLIRAIERRLA